MDVRTGRSATITHQGNDVASANHIADFDKVFLIVRIASNDAIAVRNFYHFSIAVSLATPANNTARYSDDVGAFATCEIDAFVPRFLATEWIDARAEMRGQPAR